MASLNDTIELNKTQILKGRLLTVVTPLVLFDVLLDTLPTKNNPVDKDQIMPDFENKLNAKLGGNPVDGSLHFDHALEMLQSDAHRNAINVQTDQGKIWIVLPNADPDVIQHLDYFWRLKRQEPAGG